MSSRQQYSEEFKDAIVTKIVNRGSSSVLEVCAREGIKASSVYRWMRRDNVGGMKTKHASKSWTASQKFQAVSETFSTSDAETGLYLRREGLYSHQVEEWRGQVLASLEPTPKRPAAKDVRDDRIKELEREILRKDRALAEASALLILQKKVNLIWGDEDPK